MVKISDADLQVVRSRASLAELVGETVELKKGGADRLVAVCPFPEHDDRSPSFNINVSGNLYYCHGCGRGGDAIRYVQETQSVTFPEAVEILADRFAIALTPVEDGVVAAPNHRKLITSLNAEAHEFFQQQLLNGEDSSGRDFIAQRGYDLTAAVTEFGMGYAPTGRRGSPTLLAHMTSRGHRVTDLVRAGLISMSAKQSPYDFFRGRPTWAIRDPLGRILGFGARRIHDDDRNPGKFINTTETDAYKKTHVLFGIDFAKRTIAQTKQAVVVEGYMDVMATHLSGVRNTTATCGTSMTEEHVAALAKLVGADGELVFFFDGDKAGQDALFKAYDKTKASGVRRLSALVLGEGMDPDDLLKTGGAEAVQALLDQRIPLIEATLRRVIGQLARETFEDRIVAVDETMPYLLAIEDHAIRENYAQLVAELLDVPFDHVAPRAKLGKRAVQREEAKKAKQQIEAVAQRGGQHAGNLARHLDEQRAIQLALLHPSTLDIQPGLLDETYYTHPVARGLLAPISGWRGHGGMPGLFSILSEEQQTAVARISGKPFAIEEKGLIPYARVLFARLNLALIESQIEAQEQFLDTDGAVNFDLLDKLQSMKRERDEMRKLCA